MKIFRWIQVKIKEKLFLKQQKQIIEFLKAIKPGEREEKTKKKLFLQFLCLLHFKWKARRKLGKARDREM